MSHAMNKIIPPVARNRNVGTISWERLRDLARFRAQHGCAISFYIGFDPSTTPTLPDAATKINSLLDEAHKSAFANRSELTHDQKVGLQNDLERIRRWLSVDFRRNGTNGVAIFAAGPDNFWNVVTVGPVLPDEVRTGPDFYLSPLVPLVGRGDGALVVVVGREKGVILRLNNGRLEELEDLTEEQPGRHDQGGWSQARFQRHIDELADKHLRTVAEELDRHVRVGTADRIVIVCPEDTKGEFEDMLTHEVRKAVVGWAAGEQYATPAELLAIAEPWLEEARRAKETAVLARWQEEAGRNGRAASGWEQTLEAASDGRVDLLLFSQDARKKAYQCPQCGRASMTNGACPLDGTAMEERVDATDVAIHQTLEHGGIALALSRERPELGPVEGIAALLRF
jgi:peptide chain release factor subunit 1